MRVYMVERSLPGIEMDQLAAAQKAAIETSDRFTAEGKDVRATSVSDMRLSCRISDFRSQISNMISRGYSI